MNHPLPSVTYPSLKQLLLSRLQAALALYVTDDSALKKQQDRRIPLHRAKNDNRVLYVSGIALQLSGDRNIPALEIATALSSKLVVDITVEVVPPGWIHLEVTEPKLAAWLQYLVQGEQMSPHLLVPPSSVLESSDRRKPPLRLSASRLFAVQYAHARCCSLMQLAQHENLITHPIPWLNDHKLRFCHPAERALIAQLVGLLDDLYCPSPSHQPINWEKAALNLSQAFQTFYSCCRIWGEVKVQAPHLAQARLGLVMATQVILQLLLQDMFGVYAPLEL